MAEIVHKEIIPSTETILREAMRLCTTEAAAFALWKLPTSPSVFFAAGSDITRISEVNLEETSTGFLFAPFDPNEEKIFLPAREMFTIENGNAITSVGSLLERASNHPKNPKSETERNYYSLPLKEIVHTAAAGFIDLVGKCRDAVLSGSFEKLVPSRSKDVVLPSSFDIASVFIELGKRYPAAMVSVFSSPETGTWMGATPEMLVSVDNQQTFRTVAVAGTQPYMPGADLKSITWAQKEIEEQALVERYIIGCFKKIRLREFEEHGPRTVVAGNVVHLKTEFEVDMAATRYPQLGSVMLKLLHPTSAVCGMPMEQSLALLKANEGYPREFYSGYLGPVNVNQESHLFVNLRCMQLSEGKARLYAGGGVLGDSDPEKEWQETELKMNTLLSVIRD